MANRTRGWGAFLCLQAALLLGCQRDLEQKYWERAEFLVKQGQYERAIDELRRVVASQQNPTQRARAERRIATIYQDYLKDYAKAVASLRDVVRHSDNDDLKFQARWNIAKIYRLNLGNPYRASEEYQSLFEEYGKSKGEGPALLLDWAETLNETGNAKGAVQTYQKFIEFFPSHAQAPRVMVLLGQSFLASGQIQEAVRQFETVIGAFLRDDYKKAYLAEAYFGLGQALEVSEAATKAIDAYNRALEHYPNPEVVRIKIERLTEREKKRKQ